MVEEKKETQVEKKSVGQVFKDSFIELGQTFKAFVKAPRALWGLNIPYVIEGITYFGFVTILVTFCGENLGMNDLHSGWVAGFLTGGITFAMLLMGGIADKIGVRLSLALSLMVMAVGRGIVALSGTIDLGAGLWSPMFFAFMVGVVIIILGYGLYQPAAYAGVKRWTNPQTAAMGYAVIYGLMNLGAFLSGMFSPVIRHAFKDTLPPNGLPAVIWFYTGLTVVASILTLMFITKKADKNAVDRVKIEADGMAKDGKKDEKKEEQTEKHDIKVNNNPLIAFVILAVASLVFAFLIKAGKVSMPSWIGWGLVSVFAFLTCAEFLRKRPDHPFWDRRFVFFIFILIPVQTLFAHNWLTIPVYLQRAFGVESAANQYFEFFSNLNPIIIFVLAPLVAGLTARANVYRMMIIGTIVMALPTFLLVIGPNIHLFVLYIVLMSIGEAMWQPRFLQWIAEIAPKGKTGMYMGIGQFPWFLTKMITAAYSGWFLSQYIPDPSLGKAINSESLWLIYSLIAMASPIALIVARKWMYKGMTKNG